MNKTAAMISLGCAKNRVNSEQMMYLLREAGYYVTGETDKADVVIINTCGFIESAKEEAIDNILEMVLEKAAGNIGKLVVAGCLPERYKDNILKELPEIDAIVGTGCFDDIVRVVEDTSRQHTAAPAYFGDIHAPVSETGRIISTSHTWAYLKIAEGCSNNCAYCCIPAIRGRLRSRPVEAIVREAVQLASRGYKELILVAQDTTAYGRDLYGQSSICTLLQELGGIEGLSWIRLMYLYPDGFDEKLIDEIVNNGKIVKYLDIPIQHINDKILRKMNRRGSSAGIRDLFRTLRERIPGLVLRTSIITGLPGEGEQEFEELCRFLEDTRIERAGVFAYSPEEGTKAALMKRPGERTAVRRTGIVQEIQSQIMSDFNNSRAGTLADVLIEEQADTELLARSYAEAPEVDGYIRVKPSGTLTDESRFRDFVRVKLAGVQGGELIGEEQ